MLLKKNFFNRKIFKAGLIFSILVSNISPALASSLKAPKLEQNRVVSLAQVANSQSSLADGVYLYGQAEEPEQLGSEYLVFQVRQGKIQGAFYMPSSEFDCFSGQATSNGINLSIVNPEDNTTYSHSIAFEKTSTIAAEGDRVQRSLDLEGYHQIDKISKQDRELIRACQNN
jgi:hypothetical protein